jgi:hypothetical protein
MIEIMQNALTRDIESAEAAMFCHQRRLDGMMDLLKMETEIAIRVWSPEQDRTRTGVAWEQVNELKGKMAEIRKEMAMEAVENKTMFDLRKEKINADMLNVNENGVNEGEAIAVFETPVGHSREASLMPSTSSSGVSNSIVSSLTIPFDITTVAVDQSGGNIGIAAGTNSDDDDDNSTTLDLTASEIGMPYTSI